MKNVRPLKEIITRNPTIYLLSLMIFFWTMFDATMSYITPLLISNNGFSNTVVGLIYGTSSLAGAIFDFLICKFFKNTKYRRLFLLMIIICFFYPLLLGNAKALWVFLLAMAAWGFYFDLYGFGVFDFISFYTKKEDQPASFGTVQTFRSLGGIIAPVIVGAVLVGALFLKLFILAEILLFVALIFYIILIIKTKNTKPIIPQEAHHKKKNFLKEIDLWKKIGKKLLPCLTVTFFLYTIEAFFWTLAPLYASTLNLGVFSGFFLAAYSLPILISGFIVGNVAKKYGRTKLAFVSLMFGSLILAFFMFISATYWSIILIFCSAFFFGMALPSINGAYSEYIDRVPVVEGEIEALEDFSFNIGYVIGPISAGLLSDLFNIPITFTILGVVGFLVALFLLVFVPEKIKLETKDIK